MKKTISNYASLTFWIIIKIYLYLWCYDYQRAINYLDMSSFFVFFLQFWWKCCFFNLTQIFPPVFYIFPSFILGTMIHQLFPLTTNCSNSAYLFSSTYNPSLLRWTDKCPETSMSTLCLFLDISYILAFFHVSFHLPLYAFP